ncbi:MAG: hypothetical protein ACXAB7_03495 [Candidatus Kariarchaeaceae archaeon]|jgi:hypothetical protein
MLQQPLGIPSYREPLVLSLIVLMIHKELRLSEIKITTGSTFEQVRQATQALLNLKMAIVADVLGGDPLFRIINQHACKTFLQDVALLKVTNCT